MSNMIMGKMDIKKTIKKNVSFCDFDEEINSGGGYPTANGGWNEYSDPNDKQMCEWEYRNQQQWTTLIGGHRYTLKELREAI